MMLQTTTRPHRIIQHHTTTQPLPFMNLQVRQKHLRNISFTPNYKLEHKWRCRMGVQTLGLIRQSYFMGSYFCISNMIVLMMRTFWHASFALIHPNRNHESIDNQSYVKFRHISRLCQHNSVYMISVYGHTNHDPLYYWRVNDMLQRTLSDLLTDLTTLQDV